MQAELIQSMHERVRAIHRALTGEDVQEATGADAADGIDSVEAVTQRFAELEAMAQTLPSVMARVAPYSFTPPVDVIATDKAILLEIAIPGVDRDAITIERLPNALVIGGVRRVSQTEGGALFHAEIPRGPFVRMIPLPFEIDSDPRVELDRGVLRVYLPVVMKPTVEQRNDSNGSHQATDTQRRTSHGDGG
jgi:HSP20 family protein